jgi:hypothetical protein
MESSYSNKELDPKGYSPNDFYRVSVVDKLNSLDCAAETKSAETIDCGKSTITETQATTCYNSQLCRTNSYRNG